MVHGKPICFVTTFYCLNVALLSTGLWVPLYNTIVINIIIMTKKNKNRDGGGPLIFLQIIKFLTNSVLEEELRIIRTADKIFN